MLVKLYQVSDDPGVVARLAARGIVIRRSLGPEKRLTANWVGGLFEQAWASETDVAFSHQPISCFVAVHDGAPVGFGCYDTAALGFFGPTGVEPAFRNLGIGHALLLACLIDMRVKGYGYAIIGGAGPTEFYRRAVGATEIPDSVPGIYAGLMGNSTT